MVFTPYYRGGKRMEEEERGGKRMEEEAGGRGWLCALGAEHVAEQMTDGGDGVLGSNEEGA